MRFLRLGLTACVCLMLAACGHERPNIFEVPKHQPGPNPFRGNKLFVDPNMHSVKQADAWRAHRPEDAALMDKIATQPQAEWLGEWSGAVKLFVRGKMTQYADAGAMGLFIVYNDSRGLYDLFPDRAERTDRSLTIKFSRMFDVLQ